MRPDPDKVLWVAAFDGGKALIFKNNGFDDAPDLELIERFDNDNPPDREQTTDAPGRYQDAGGGRAGVDAQVAHGRSSVQQTDRHELEKTRFVDRLMDRLNADAEARKYDRLILMAPERALGAARDHYGHRLTERLEHEEAKDLVQHTTDEIEQRVKAILAEKDVEPKKSHLGVSGPEAE